MSDAEIDAAIAVHEAAIEALRQHKPVVQPPVTPAPPPANPVVSARQKPRPRWMPAARAFADRGFPFDDWLIRRICGNHDWALKLPGGWHVDHAKFEEFATLVERRQANFSTAQKSEPSESSVANSAQASQKD